MVCLEVGGVEGWSGGLWTPKTLHALSHSSQSLLIHADQYRISVPSQNPYLNLVTNHTLDQCLGATSYYQPPHKTGPSTVVAEDQTSIAIPKYCSTHSYFYVHHVIKHSLLSATSQVDGKPSLVGKLAYCFEYLRENLSPIECKPRS